MAVSDALLDIDQVNQLTGLPQATLRNWEKRYGFPRPKRSEGGHRLYDVDEVKRIREVVSLYNGGLKISEAIRKILSGASPNTSGSVPNQQSAFAVPVETLDEGLTQILNALYSYNVVQAEQLLSRIGMRLSETDLLEMVYPKLLMQVGDDWERARINIAQEHFSWNFLRTRLLNYFKTNNKSSAHQPKVVLATPSGELHEGGLILLAGYLMLKGWDVYYLGVSLPMEDLLHAVLTIEPDMVCLSAINASSIQENWKNLEKLNRPVVLGGPCLRQLKLQESAIPTQVFLVDGSLQSAFSQMELLFHSVARK